jgi:hypothetical protein
VKRNGNLTQAGCPGGLLSFGRVARGAHGHGGWSRHQNLVRAKCLSPVVHLGPSASPLRNVAPACYSMRVSAALFEVPPNVYSRIVSTLSLPILCLCLYIPLPHSSSIPEAVPLEIEHGKWLSLPSSNRGHNTNIPSFRPIQDYLLSGRFVTRIPRTCHITSIHPPRSLDGSPLLEPTPKSSRPSWLSITAPLAPAQMEAAALRGRSEQATFS